MAKKHPKKRPTKTPVRGADKSGYSRNQPPPMFEFTPAEIARAVNILAEFYQDHPMEREMMRIKTYSLINELKKRGVTRALAERLIDELIGKGVYFKGRQYVNLRTYVPLSGGEQIDLGSQEFWHLYSTRSRLRRYFSDRQASGEGVPVYEFRRKGEYWQLTYEHKTIFLKSTTGLHYIAQLLRDPKRQLPAVFLLAARTGIDPLSAQGSSGELLDGEARDRYWKQYVELKFDLEAAAATNDAGSVEQLRRDIAAIENELLRACGLGGRDRSSSDPEKVRKSVSNAVARDLQRITLNHEPLGRHLMNAISAGQTLSYSPDASVNWLL